MEIVLDISNWLSDFFVQSGAEELVDQMIQKGQVVKDLGDEIKDTAEKAQRSQPKTWLGLQAFDNDFWWRSHTS